MLTWEGVWPNSLARRPPWLHASSVKNKKTIWMLPKMIVFHLGLTYWFRIFIFISGDSIKCWVCRSDGDPKCADPFDNTSFPIADCAREKPREHLPGLQSTMCRKVRQKGVLSISNCYVIYCKAKSLSITCIQYLNILPFHWYKNKKGVGASFPLYTTIYKYFVDHVQNI